MTGMRVLVLRAAGINCDEEVMHCWRLVGAKPTLVHVNALARDPSMLDDVDLVTIPGGFSYGDDLGAGTILAQRILHDLTEALRRLVDRGGGILGVCNGFQVLVKMGLLPGGDFGPDQVTITSNVSARFEARWVRLEIGTDRCPFLNPGNESARQHTTRSTSRATGLSPRETPTASRASMSTQEDDRRSYLELPVEHAEGQVVTRDDTVTRQLEAAGHVALRYVDANGRCDAYPANPNGSVAGIAGLCDSTGRIFGLMPHPDRFFDPTHHPLWTRRRSTRSPDGLTVFQNAAAHWSR